MSEKKWLRGGTVITSRAAGEVLESVDVLIDGDRIAAVGPGLDAGDDEVAVPARQ